MSRFLAKRSPNTAIEDNTDFNQKNKNQNHKRSRPELDDEKTSDLPHKVKFVCQIIADSTSAEIESILDDTGMKISQKDVEDILKHSYASPASSVKFFRWAGRHINHSPYAWNLVVDLLGKNGLFDAMWDCIRSMQQEHVLSLATFASVFSSYVSSGRESEALMTFDVMEQYGCPRDIAALNSLLSAACRESKTAKAMEFLRVSRDKVVPDVDTYAILLEGWENESNSDGAKQVFCQMIGVLGWEKGNYPAYDSYLIALLNGRDGVMDAFKAFDLLNRMGCLPSKRFFKAAMEACAASGHVKGGLVVWADMMQSRVCSPDTEMYNSLIELRCHSEEMGVAFRALDEMVYNGVFPDCDTYNILMRYAVKLKMDNYASFAFKEMVKNEFVPSFDNCRDGIMFFINSGKADLAIRAWKLTVENYKSKVEEIGNSFVIALRDGNRLPEAVKYAREMVDCGVKVNSSTLSKLKQSLTKEGKTATYEELLKKWKNHSSG